MKSSDLPMEFDLRAAPHGYTMAGWDFTRDEVAEAIAGHRMLNPAIELGTNVCPWNCDFCFTESPMNLSGRKKHLEQEMPLERRLHLIDEAADLGCRSINFVGAGEPTLDPGFWPLLERMRGRNITPIIYTEGTLRLLRPGFASRMFDLGATVVLKVNSLANADYQDRVLRGIRSKPGVPTVSYTAERAKVLDLLMELGFNRETPTRLAFDTIICRENVDEIESIHRFAREQNIFVLFVNFLPSGRTAEGHSTAITWNEQHKIFERLAEIDKMEFGLSHGTSFPYAGGVPCTIRGLGLFVKIQGSVFDCPGELAKLGDLKETSLSEIWQKARSITCGFDGLCLPRREFWNRMALLATTQAA